MTKLISEFTNKPESNFAEGGHGRNFSNIFTNETE